MYKNVNQGLCTHRLPVCLSISVSPHPLSQTHLLLETPLAASVCQTRSEPQLKVKQALLRAWPQASESRSGQYGATPGNTETYFTVTSTNN